MIKTSAPASIASFALVNLWHLSKRSMAFLSPALPGWLVVAGGATGARARPTAASGPSDRTCAAVAALADGREQGDGAGGVAATALSAGCWRIGLAHGAKLLKGCLTIDATVLVYGHDPGLRSGSGPL